MNSTERIMSTLAGHAVDRRAVTPVLCLYGSRLTNCPLQEYYTNPDAYARGQAAVRQTFEPDVLFTPLAFASLGAAFGSEVQFYNDQAPNVRRPAITSIQQWDALVFPDPQTHPQLLFIRQALRQMVAEHKGEVPIAVPLPPSTDLPMLIFGLEAWLDIVLFDPSAAQRVMSRIDCFFAELVNALFADGAALAVLTCVFASPAFAPRELVESFARPAMKKALVELRGPVVLHHGGAPLLANLDLLTGLPGVVGFALDPRDDLAEARRRVGPEPVLFAGPMAPALAGMTPGQVSADCMAVLENRRHDPRFVLYSAGPDIPWQTPPENIHALRQAAEGFGGFTP